MEKEKAVNILIANACCSSTELTCSDCPLCIGKGEIGDDCNGFSDSDLFEAVKSLNI